MSGSPSQHAAGGPQEAGAGGAAAAVAAADELEAAMEELGPPRVSEELRPMSLTDLFAEDPECAKPKQNPGQAGLARTHTFAGAGLDDELELKKLQVFVRIRPGVTAGAPRWDTENCIHATSRYSIAIAPPEGSQAYKSGDRGQTYSFTRVFDEHTVQTEYYEATAAPLVRDLLRNARHNSVMMAYGITAAGKTYTIEGTKDAPGVMPRALVDLFAGLDAHVDPLVARASYYEVYNEQIYDLLDEHGVGPLGQRAALRLKEDTLGRVFVAGLSEVDVTSADEALALLRRGSRQRQRGETALNYSSSRSHSIFTVTLYQQGLEGQDSERSGSGQESEEGVGSEERLGRISFVDLAGSERAQRTGNVGVRLKESVAINSSLMTLGRCLEALRWNQQHKGGSNLRVVPYRESKVTHLFRDALHGWGQVILSVNVSPASKDYDETAHVLKYAALATQIGTIQAAEAPRRTIKAVSPAIKKVKRKAALPPEARGQGAKAKKTKKAAAAPAADKPADVEADNEMAEAAAGETEQQEPGVQQQQSEEHGGDVAVQLSPHGLADADEGGPDAAAAEVAEYELGEAEWEGTPATPLGHGEEDEATAALQAQVQQLIGDLQRAEERCVLLEAEVREEVADEMAQLLRDMEESYRQRLEAEVAALEKKAAAGAAAEGGRRGKRGGKAGKTEQADASAAEELAAAREDAAHAASAAEQLRGQVAELQAAAERQQAEAAEQATALQATVDAAQQAAAQSQERLAAEQQRAAELEKDLAAARQEAANAAASLGAAQQHSAALEAELAAAREQAAAAAAEAAAERQRAEGLEAELAAARSAADSSQAAASQQFEAQLQEAVTQLEANKCMELEMAEEQGERLRKENLALQQRLGAALAALATYGSPSAGGPGALVARMAQAAPEGNGRGAGGTPHDVALARARQAAAADELAAAAAAAGAAGSTAGASTAPRSRSRFALEAEAPMPGGAPAGQLDTVAEEGEEEQLGQLGAAQQQQQEEEQPPATEADQPRQRRGRGRPRKAVAFAGLEDAAAEVQAAAPAAQLLQQQAVAVAEPAPQQAAGESRRSRRVTRAGAALAAAAPPLAAAAEQQQQPAVAAVAGGAAAEEAAKPKRQARRKTQAAALPPVSEAAEVEVHEAAPIAAAEQQQEAAPTKPGRRGRRKTQAVPLAPLPEGPAEVERQHDAGQPAPAPQVAAEVAAEQGAAPGPAEAPAAALAQQPAAAEAKPRKRRAAKPAAQTEKENAPEQPPAAQGSLAAALAAIRRSGGGSAAAQAAAKAVAAAGDQDVQQAQQAKQQQDAAAADGGRGGKRKRRLLPSAPISLEMRAALGEVDGESVPLRQQIAARQAAAAAPADGGAKRTRRQTTFFRL